MRDADLDLSLRDAMRATRDDGAEILYLAPPPKRELQLADRLCWLLYAAGVAVVVVATIGIARGVVELAYSLR